MPVRGDGGADLQLEMPVALVECFLQQAAHLVLAVAQPAGGGGVGGHGVVLLGLLHALGFTWLFGLQDGDGLLGCDGVCDVAEIDAFDELLGAHLGDDAPDGLAEGFGPQVPDGVDDGAQGEMDHTLFWADPAQL